jgi:hypothetical protein
MMQQKSLTILAWLALTLSALFAAPAMADDIGGSKRFGLGIAGGYYSNTLTAKYYLQDKAAIQGFVGAYQFEGLSLAVDYVIEPIELAKGGAGRLFLGVGGGADFWSWGSYSTIGVHAIVELGWHFKALPLEFVADWRPTFLIGDSGGFAGRGGHGAVRWYF